MKQTMRFFLRNVCAQGKKSRSFLQNKSSFKLKVADCIDRVLRNRSRSIDGSHEQSITEDQFFTDSYLLMTEMSCVLFKWCEIVNPDREFILCTRIVLTEKLVNSTNWTFFTLFGHRKRKKMIQKKTPISCFDGKPNDEKKIYSQRQWLEKIDKA